MAAVIWPVGAMPSAMRRTALMKKFSDSGLWSVTSGGAERSTSARRIAGSSSRQTAQSAIAGPTAINAA